jgi:hypothetical protein
VRIRTPRTAELPVLQDIERAAGRQFRDVGRPEIARGEPLPLDELARYQRAGRAWIAALGDGGLVAGWAAARCAPALTLTTFANVPCDGRYGPPVPGDRSFSTRWNNRWSRQAPSM